MPLLLLILSCFSIMPFSLFAAFRALLSAIIDAAAAAIDFMLIYYYVIAAAFAMLRYAMSTR